jgi:hypothetical protein
MLLSVHVWPSTVATICDCRIPYQFTGFHPLKPVAAHLICLFQESLSRSRIVSTFYEDLGRVVHEVAPQAHIAKDYLVEGKTNAEDYPIDYRLDFPGNGRPATILVWDPVE